MRLRHVHRISRAGFTLIELMIVLVLIAIMTAMIIPEMRGTYEAELLRSSSRGLIRALSAANSQSITVNQRHRLVIDLENHTYQVERYTRDPESQSAFLPVQGVSGTKGSLDERIEISIPPANDEPDQASPFPGGSSQAQSEPSTPGSLSINFYPDGTADKAGIELRDRDGFGLGLQLNPLTARVKVQELPRRMPTQGRY